MARQAQKCLSEAFGALSFPREKIIVRGNFLLTCSNATTGVSVTWSVLDEGRDRIASRAIGPLFILVVFYTVTMTQGQPRGRHIY